MTADRIDFDTHEERSVRRASSWMLAAAAGSVVQGLDTLTTDVVDLAAALGLFAMGILVGIAGWSFRRLATTDGRDQEHLARALRRIRTALIVRGLFLGLVMLLLALFLASAGMIGLGALLHG